MKNEKRPAYNKQDSERSARAGGESVLNYIPTP